MFILKDAHIAIADYDADTSLFAVFDGHGGPEVSKYCAQHLPKFIKSLNSYQTNQLKECLEEAFLKFDKTLTEKEVIQELKILSQNPEVDNEDNDTDDDINEAILLREEADLPISELMKRYNSDPIPTPESECGSSSNIRVGLSLPIHMRCETKERSKPVSPYLRAKRSAINECNHLKEGSEQQSGSSGVEVCSSSSGASNSLDSTEDIAEAKPEPESSDTVIKQTNEEEVTQSSNGLKVPKPSQDSNVSNGEVSQSDEIDSQSKASSEVNSSDAKPSEIDSTVVSSNEKSGEEWSGEESSTPYKGKGKYKKIITPKQSNTDSKTDSKSSEESEKPIYQYFMEDMDEEEEESEDSEDFEGNDGSSDEDEDELNDMSDSESEEEEQEERPTPCFEKPGYDSGCTAVVALLKGNQLVVANAGDSRCVVSRNGKAIDMSVDHKPEDDIERERISKAGGKVTRDGRVNGGLNLSRAIGDHAYKQNKEVTDREQMITALPDIRTLEIDPKTDDFMVIACDGIWYSFDSSFNYLINFSLNYRNSLTSQQVIDFVGERIQKCEKLSTICDEVSNDFQKTD